MKIFINNWNNVLDDTEDELKKRGHEVLTSYDCLKNLKRFDIVVFWNETDTGAGKGFKTWRNYVKDCKKAGIGTVLVQHGRRGTSRIFPPFNEKLESDAICCWGEADKKTLISVGVPSEKIFVTGTSIIKSLKPREKQEIPTIVFSPEHWSGGEVDENLCIAGELRKLEGVQIITKLLEREHKIDWYDNPVVSDRGSRGHLKTVADVLAKADVVVSLMDGTFELMAQILDIPVVLADIWIPKPLKGDDRYRGYNRIYSDACRKAKFKELNDFVEYAIKHPEHLREERKKIALADGGIDIKDPTMNIVKIIENARPTKSK